MSNNLNNWTEEEINFVKNNFYNMTVKDIANKLNKNVNSVYYKIRKLGLKKQNHKEWTNEENEFLIKNYMETSKFLSGKLGRTIASINTQRDKLGLIKDKPWTQTDINYLKEHYVNDLYSDIAIKLCRSEGAIRAKCNELGLVQKDEWDDDDVEFLSNNYMELSNEELSKILNRTPNSIHLKASKLGLKKYPYHCDYNYFEKIDTEEKAYWLGFLIADGWISKNDSSNAGVTGIELQYGDINHLKKFNKSINGNYKITDRWRKCTVSGTNSVNHECLIRIFSLTMYNSLAKFGFDNSKSYNVDIPKINNELIRHLIRGYFDGDGCFAFTSKSFGVSFISASKSLADSINNILLSLGIETHRHNYISDYDTQMYRTYIYKKSDKIKLLDYMYEDASIYLDRKYNKYLKVKNHIKNHDMCLAI